MLDDLLKRVGLKNKYEYDNKNSRNFNYTCHIVTPCLESMGNIGLDKGDRGHLATIAIKDIVDWPIIEVMEKHGYLSSQKHITFNFRAQYRKVYDQFFIEMMYHPYRKYFTPKVTISLVDQHFKTKLLDQKKQCMEVEKKFIGRKVELGDLEKFRWDENVLVWKIRFDIDFEEKLFYRKEAETCREQFGIPLYDDIWKYFDLKHRPARKHLNFHIEVENTTVSLHKEVLPLTSKFFAKFFKQNPDANRIALKDYEFNTVRSYVLWVYTGTFFANEWIDVRLFELSWFLEDNAFKKAVQQWFIPLLSIYNRNRFLQHSCDWEGDDLADAVFDSYEYVDSFFCRDEASCIVFLATNKKYQDEFWSRECEFDDYDALRVIDIYRSDDESDDGDLYD